MAEQTKIRHIDYYPDEYVAGVGGQLSAIEQGVYWMVCSLIYSRGGPIDDDHVWLSRLFADTHWRTIRTTIDALVASGKIERIATARGMQLTVTRCARELQKALTRSSQASQNGGKGGRPSKKNKQLAEPEGFYSGKLTTNLSTTNHQPSISEPNGSGAFPLPPSGQARPAEPVSDTTRTGEPASRGTTGSLALVPPEDQALDEPALAMAAYNAQAKISGWPSAAALTRQRRAALKARLAECGGLEAFKRAMERAGSSPFLTGQSGRGEGHENWRPDIDFLCKPKYFTRLLEGAYDAVGPAKHVNGNSGRKLDPEDLHDAQLMLEIGRKQRRWHRGRWGPPPGEPGCKIPASLLQPGDGVSWREWDELH